jgi:predicted GNAT family acetyltransferase
MEIQHDKKYQQFTIKLEGDEAELAYALPGPGVISFTHTFVPESGRGMGISDKLIRAGLQYAKENSLKVTATCPVVKAFLKRHPEYDDLQK